MFERFTDRVRRVVVLAQDDDPEQIATIARKIAEMRLFDGEASEAGAAVRPR